MQNSLNGRLIWQARDTDSRPTEHYRPGITGKREISHSLFLQGSLLQANFSRYSPFYVSNRKHVATLGLAGWHSEVKQTSRQIGAQKI
jgi:hypothetical protein